MLRNTIYYRIKPFVPKFVRMAVRRRMALRARSRVSGVWPISPGSEKKPAGWPGWPHGKQFAFVLTHDVEGPAGMRNVPALFDLVRGMGFRSSFNLIPEGDYHVPADVRAELTRHGFEVGVHDLEHDGRLYQSKTRFLRNAARINQYLHDWQASGFRSGFMLHNLDWLHELDIAYDASTFDTDPFEPQPEGTHTIFPFWLPRPADPEAGPSARTGYVELSYTLPQDSTVFLLLGEQTARTWTDKLDWVAAQGGMALVNIHPDYIDFSGGQQSARGKYPVARVRGLLEHVAARYGDRCWNPCARELAGWFVASGASPSMETKTEPAPVPPVPTTLRGKRAAVLLYSHYPADPRPRRAAEALVEAGMEVDLICLRENDGEPASETVGGVNVRRIPLRRQRGRKLSYLFLYSRFILRCFLHLAWHGWRRKYDLIHVHNMPDVLVFATLVPKLFGARIVLDLHDPMPELMTSIYELDRNNWLVRVLRCLERWSIAMADLALTPNVTFKNLFVSRSCRAGKMRIVMNSPEQQIFDPDRPDLTAADGPDGTEEFRLMHHGSIVHRHGVDLLVEAVARVCPRLPGVRLDIYGSPTPFLEVVLETARRLGVAHLVRYHGAKTQAEIAEAIRHCHLGVVPNRRSAFTDINLPTRLFEYLAMHRPVLAPSTQGIRDYFALDELFMFDRDDVDGLAEKILWVAAHPQEAAACVERGLRVYRQHLWEHEKAGFLSHIAALVRTRRTSTPEHPPANVSAVRENIQPAAERTPRLNISIFGLGYVGCVGMGCMAQHGHRVIGVDPQPSKVEFINSGRPTIIEKDIAEIIAERHAQGMISATSDTVTAIGGTDVSLICVGTPSTAQGHLDLTAVRKVAAQIGEALRHKTSRHVIALRSTVLPGTGQTVSNIIAESSGREAGKDFAVVSNPEFLREGTSVEDFNRPPYTLIGTECPWAIDAMREVYARIDAPFITTRPAVAELMKYVCNSFHALKITFANEIGSVCKALGIDSHELMSIFCQDTQLNISPAYLKPGFAFGGSCLPKDLRALRTIAHDHYLQTPLLESIERSNALQKERVLQRISAAGKQNVGFLGVAFKAGTDDLRESPILDVIEPLLGKGFNVSIYDEHVHIAKLTGANREYILQKIPYISRFITDDLEAVVSASDLLVVVNKQPGVVEALRRCENKIVLELTRTGLTSSKGGAAVDGVAW